MSKTPDDTPTDEEISPDWARLIGEDLNDSVKRVLFRSLLSSVDCKIPPGTSLVYGDVFASKEFNERFKTLLRTFFERAGLRELSYLDDFHGSVGKLWIMLVECDDSVDFRVGVYVCRCASDSWTMQQILQRPQRYPKRRLSSVLKLLIPDYLDCDPMCPLAGLILPAWMESSATTHVAVERHDDTRRPRDE